MSAPKNAILKYTGMFRHLLGFAPSFLKYHIKGKITPQLAGYKITNRCNLRCSHCPYWRRNVPDQDFFGVKNTLKLLHELNVKILIIEGGEPLLWNDGARNIRDVVSFASKLFPSVCVTTNGLLPWENIGFDKVWVSLDGPREIHDAIRGKGAYEKALGNIITNSAATMVSSTISSFNAHSIPELLKDLKGLIKGITFQFYYPYNGLPDSLFLGREHRIQILDELITMKKQGFPVANSIGCLMDMKKELWTCFDRLLVNAEPNGAIQQGCYLKNRAESNCRLCGFTAHNEISLAYKGRLGSIYTGVKIFF